MIVYFYYYYGCDAVDMKVGIMAVESLCERSFSINFDLAWVLRYISFLFIDLHIKIVKIFQEIFITLRYG